MYRHLFKRLFDIIIGLLALPFVLLLICVLGPIIYFSDKGTIFYKAKRIGQGGRLFGMYKFRSMIMNAPDIRMENGDTYNGDDDPRVTQIGRFMRKTSIDELPQLVNILKGDMSIVGPRPPLPKEVAQYSDWDWGRLAVRPGLTCYWQVSGRSNLSFDEWMRLDLKYIEEQGLWTDLRIIARTVGVVLRGDGAY